MSKTLSITAAVAALMNAASTAGHTLTEDKARELVKANKIASMKRVNEAVESLKKPNGNKGRIRTTRTVEPGARGFRFAGKWNESVAAADGIAVHPFYLPKLKAHAKAMGVSSAGTDAVAMCKAIVQAGGPEVPVVEEAAA